MSAPRALHAQQPTLSRHVAEIEAHLDVPLFERTGRSAVPTAAALPTADAARRMDQVAYGRLVASGAGIGFVTRYNLAHWSGVEPLLPMLAIPPLPCWLAVHREIRGNRFLRRVYDFLAEELQAVIGAWRRLRGCA